MSHTPGEWKIDTRKGRLSSSWNGAAIKDANGVKIASLSAKADRSLFEKEANAHLITSAPELLWALQIARIEIETLDKPNQNVLKVIYKAIAKAEGK